MDKKKNPPAKKPKVTASKHKLHSKKSHKKSAAGKKTKKTVPEDTNQRILVPDNLAQMIEQELKEQRTDLEKLKHQCLQCTFEGGPMYEKRLREGPAVPDYEQQKYIITALNELETMKGPGDSCGSCCGWDLPNMHGNNLPECPSCYDWIRLLTNNMAPSYEFNPSMIPEPYLSMLIDFSNVKAEKMISAENKLKEEHLNDILNKALKDRKRLQDEALAILADKVNWYILSMYPGEVQDSCDRVPKHRLRNSASRARTDLIARVKALEKRAKQRRLMRTLWVLEHKPPNSDTATNDAKMKKKLKKIQQQIKNRNTAWRPLFRGLAGGTPSCGCSIRSNKYHHPMCPFCQAMDKETVRTKKAVNQLAADPRGASADLLN